jgi:hypothetical protein
VSDRWTVNLTDTLDDIGRRLARLAESVAGDWPDQGGRDWTERAVRLRSELAEQAAVAGRLGGEGTPPDGPGATGAERPGIRLGDTDGYRVDDQRGVRIAELPPR